MATFSGKVVGGNLRLRENPSTTAEPLLWIPDNTNVTVETFTGNGSQDWFKTTYDGQPGYVMARWIAIVSGGTGGSVSTQSGPLNIRALPSTSAAISFTLARGSSLRILDLYSVSGWYRIGCSVGSGWGSSYYIAVQV